MDDNELRNLLRDLPRESVSADFRGRVLARLDARRPPDPRSPPRGARARLRGGAADRRERAAVFYLAAARAGTRGAHRAGAARQPRARVPDIEQDFAGAAAHGGGGAAGGGHRGPRRARLPGRPSRARQGARRRLGSGGLPLGRSEFCETRRFRDVHSASTCARSRRPGASMPVSRGAAEEGGAQGDRQVVRRLARRRSRAARRPGRRLGRRRQGRPMQLVDLLGPRRYIGVQLITLTPELRRHFGVPDDRGVMVSKVIEDTPAALGGYSRSATCW